ncbi:hypothetical protein PV318_06100 [Streptomyces sp. ME02-6991-2B]|nr:hypothetical protein [Streptomyces sp. ME02-6991-2B]
MTDSSSASAARRPGREASGGASCRPSGWSGLRTVEKGSLAGVRVDHEQAGASGDGEAVSRDDLRKLWGPGSCAALLRQPGIGG